jgi:shikimate dehydrogenase
MPEKKDTDLRLFGLIGHPLTHSFSKKYFSRKFKRESLVNCRYELFPLTSLEALPGLIINHPELEGLNVTIPFKRQVMDILDNSKGIPDGLSACNCIKIVSGKMHGHNTDHTGFEKSLLPLLKPEHQKALILGNGGATSAVVFVLKKLNIGYRIVSRKKHDDSDMEYNDISPQLLAEHLLVINTTPLGMFPQVHQSPVIPYDHLTEKHLLYDLVYNPPETLFLKKGKEKGATVKNGEEMLEIQAEESWKIWNG